jgi:hypothetical protein
MKKIKLPMRNFVHCLCCGRWTACHKHHFLGGRNRSLKPGEKNEAGVKQRIVDLCSECHNDVHSISADRFFEKYRKPKTEFLYSSKSVMPIMAINSRE